MTQYRQPRGRYPPGQEQRQPLLPRGYLERGYFDKEGNVLPEVIQEWPEQLARTLLREGLKSTQLRRFFNRARAIEQQNLPFERLREEIISLKPIAAASVGRKTAPDIFKVFIDRNVDLAINSLESFSRGFLTHFQSVVAYVKYYENLPRGGSR
jgi:CRISPR type III-A-associated protein Csm2